METWKVRVVTVGFLLQNHKVVLYLSPLIVQALWVVIKQFCFHLVRKLMFHTWNKIFWNSNILMVSKTLTFFTKEKIKMANLQPVSVCGNTD